MSFEFEQNREIGIDIHKHENATNLDVTCNRCGNRFPRCKIVQYGRPGCPAFCQHLCSCGPCMFSEPLQGYLSSGGDLLIETTTIAKARVKSVMLKAMMLFLDAFRSDACPI